MSAECKRLGSNLPGLTCGCPRDACALDIPLRESRAVVVSAFTEPLAQVRDNIAQIAGCGDIRFGSEIDREKAEAYAALDRVERLAEEMEKALHEIARRDVARSVGDLASIAEAAVLSAREEGAAEEHVAGLPLYREERDRWLSECSCGWEQEAATSLEARLAWENHKSAREEGDGAR